MGRLMNPTVGDLFDRLFILGLKTEHCAEQGIDGRHFCEEAVKVAEALINSGAMMRLSAEDLLHLVRLAVLNSMIWFAEEIVAVGLPPVRLEDREAVLDALLRIRKLNGERARVADAFDSDRGPENPIGVGRWKGEADHSALAGLVPEEEEH